MSYGLFDADIPKYPYIPFFNLDLMKLSSFFKQKREIVTLSPSFSPNMYQHFILRQDFPGKSYPIIKYKNVQYGGRAFNKKKYKPLPLEIESTKPDNFLYDKIIENYQTSKRRAATFRKMKKAEHLRLSLDGQTIWKNFDSQLKHLSKNVGVIFHDYDLGAIENSYDTVIDILKDFKFFQDGQRIGMKFPVQVSTPDDLLKWSAIKPMQHFYSIQFNGIMSMPLLKEYIEVVKGTSSARQSFYNISRNTNYNHLITQDIVDIYRQVCFLRTNRIYFSLIYDEDFFQDSQWEKVITLINLFWNAPKNLSVSGFHRTNGYDSMYNFIKVYQSIFSYAKPVFSIEEIREIFQFVRLNNYELFKMFYEYKT